MNISHIAVFISDHGIGHTARLAPVLNELHKNFPSAIFHIVSGVNRFFLKERLQEIPEQQIRILGTKISVGLIEEQNSVSTSPCKTIERWKKHWSQHFECLYGDEQDHNGIPTENSMICEIEQFLEPYQIELIVWDVPEIAPVMAKRLNRKYGLESRLPLSIGISNWCWEYIYEHSMSHISLPKSTDEIVGNIDGLDVNYSKLKEEKELMVKQCRSLYSIHGKTDIFIQLPYSTNELPFGSDTIIESTENSWPITTTIKNTKYTKEYMKDWVISKSKMPSNKNYKIMMFSFGGLSFPSPTLLQEKQLEWNIPDDWIVIVMCGSSVENRMPNVVNFSFLDLEKENIDFARDLLLAVDVLVGKTSYGTVTEVLFHKIPTLYLERYGMIEHPYTEKALIENIGDSCVSKVEGDVVINALPSLFEKANTVLNNMITQQQKNKRNDIDFDGGKTITNIICSLLN
ncbi:predicted protein [Naegleria gruberi]|uniref:Predicted protein n=1 Tax=Naegleria gruberi TaxID=5762 RepID=D2VW13_NAEGR|nr:uncharacterized protein NAEGRDRAFT_73212 [Naegleria gruberi]EFC39000.1 predicted protein [Naegleria gruberi]|eukprot:XP_002671744.1 predicted protein [Naegleria gruberi strain NEG-M]